MLLTGPAVGVAPPGTCPANPSSPGRASPAPAHLLANCSQATHPWEWYLLPHPDPVPLPSTHLIVWGPCAVLSLSRGLIPDHWELCGGGSALGRAEHVLNPEGELAVGTVNSQGR